MLWLISIVTALVALYFFIAMCCSMRRKESKNIKRCRKYFFVFIVITILSFVILARISSMSYTETTKTQEYQLVSLQKSSQIASDGSGSLIYIYESGVINKKYTFYYIVENFGFKQKKIESHKSNIYEKDGIEPVIIEYTTHTKNKMNSTLYEILTFRKGEVIDKKYKIYVPKRAFARIASLSFQ